MAGSRISSHMRQMISTFDGISSGKKILKQSHEIIQSVFKQNVQKLVQLQTMQPSAIDVYRQKLFLNQSEKKCASLQNKVDSWKSELEQAPYFDVNLDKFIDKYIKIIHNELPYLESTIEVKRNRAIQEIDKAFDNIIYKTYTAELKISKQINEEADHTFSESLTEVRKSFLKSTRSKLETHKDETVARALNTSKSDKKLSRLSHAIEEFIETEKTYNFQLHGILQDFEGMKAKGKKKDSYMMDESLMNLNEQVRASDHLLKSLKKVENQNTLDQKLSTFLNTVQTDNIKEVMNEQKYGAIWYSKGFKANHKRFEKLGSRHAKSNLKLKKTRAKKYGHDLDKRISPIFQRGPRYQLLFGEMEKARELMTPKAHEQLNHLSTVVRIENAQTLFSL